MRVMSFCTCIKRVSAQADSMRRPRVHCLCGETYVFKLHSRALAVKVKVFIPDLGVVQGGHSISVRMGDSALFALLFGKVDARDGRVGRAQGGKVRLGSSEIFVLGSFQNGRWFEAEWGLGPEEWDAAPDLEEGEGVIGRREMEDLFGFDKVGDLSVLVDSTSLISQAGSFFRSTRDDQ